MWLEREAHYPLESTENACTAWDFTSVFPSLLRGELHRQKGKITSEKHVTSFSHTPTASVTYDFRVLLLYTHDRNKEATSVRPGINHVLSKYLFNAFSQKQMNYYFASGHFLVISMYVIDVHCTVV
jgi:hypothetical protein